MTLRFIASRACGEAEKDADMGMFRLKQELIGHKEDVKCVALRDGDYVTGSRDCTVIHWNGNQIAQKFEFHNKFVNAVCLLNEEQLIASAGSDSLIMIYSFLSTEPEFTLIGHTDNVCSLSSKDSLLISGSWDTTAKVWSLGECLYTLHGHESAVWTAIILENGNFLTGSADTTIKLWSGDSCVKTFKGHSDCVRSVLQLSSTSFASCSNDATVRIWDFEGNCRTLYGHTSFVYSIAISKENLISCGEDRCIRIWNDCECVQTIHYPATSIWCVAADEKEFVVGDSNGCARVFSRKEHDAELEIAFEAASSVIPSSEVEHLGNVLDELPETAENGKVLLKRSSHAVEAFRFSDNGWEKIGQVVDAIPAKQIFNGKEYDFVFDVEIDNQILKLPFNVDDNPFHAAKIFLESNNLEISFLDQTAQFIIENTKNAPKSLKKKKEVLTKLETANIAGIIKKLSAHLPSETLSTMIHSRVYDFDLIQKALSLQPQDLWPALDLLRLFLLDVSFAGKFDFHQIYQILQNIVTDKQSLPVNAMMISRVLCNAVAMNIDIDIDRVVQFYSQVHSMKSLDAFEKFAQKYLYLTFSLKTAIHNEPEKLKKFTLFLESSDFLK